MPDHFGINSVVMTSDFRSIFSLHGMCWVFAKQVTPMWTYNYASVCEVQEACNDNIPLEKPSPYGPIRKVGVYPNAFNGSACAQQLSLVDIACKIVAWHRTRKWLNFRIGLRQTI